MRLSEFDYKHSPGFERYSPSHNTPAERFAQLGINEAFPYFEDWIYHGAFNLPQPELWKYEQAFHLINSVLPPDVIDSYNELPMLYRVMRFTSNEVKQIAIRGLPIQNRIMAWAPLDTAKGYKPFFQPFVMLKHQAKESEVIVSLNQQTLDFLNVFDRLMVVNKGETILSLPILKITPHMVADYRT